MDAPLKLVDGVWFGLDGQWVGPATKFSSGWGYSRFDLPDTAGLKVERTDFAPDGRRGALFGLKITNPGTARTVKLSVDAHSELMGHYPWGFTGVVPNASDNLADKGSYDGQNLVFTDDGALPGAPEHHYAALVGTALKPDSGAIGTQFWGPQPGHPCTGAEPGAPAAPKPSQCDDGPFGRGTGGELTYAISLPAGGSKTVWLAVAGSDNGLATAQQELTRVLQDPDSQFAAKVASRERLAQMTKLSLPGDPIVQNSIEWGKQNIADLTQSAGDLRIRWTDQGKQFPASLGTVPEATWIGAGFPDYPWIFGTDAEYTAFAAVPLGQFEAIKGHLRALRDISDILNEGSGVVAHEAVADGSIWFGHDSRHTNPDGSIAYDFNTVYFIRGLYDLADMARSKHDGATFAWTTNLARKLQQRFDETWWLDAARQYADSLNDPANQQSFQKHWIGQTPMESELRVKQRTVPGLAPFDHGDTALAGRENDCFSGDAPLNPGLFHTGCGGGANGQGEKVIFGLTTSIQSIGEGNYGRLGPGQQQRYTHALAETMFSEPATGGTPDEQPGAMPEIFPSPDQGANIDRCWTCRSMFMQAWGNYGTAWAVVHQWLGVRPDLGSGRVEFVPQVPQGQTSVKGQDIRLGDGSASVAAMHAGSSYRTEIDITARTGADEIDIGHTLPSGARPTAVVLDGRVVHNYQVRQTNRGTEVTVPTTTGHHTLTITA